jgi:hypothetical protein
MHTRENPTHVASDLYDLIAPPVDRQLVVTDKIQVDLCVSNEIKFPNAGGESGNVTLPATAEGIFALGDWLKIPTKFLGRLDPEVQDNLLNALLQRTHDETVIKYNDDGIVDVVPTNDRQIDPREIVDIAIRVIGPEADVVDWRKDATGYGFDLIVPVDYAGGVIGGDAQVGDLTRGGLRFGQDLKHNLAPWVQRYLYRLVCTNGMEIPSQMRFNARGMTTEGIIESLEEEAQAAFDKLDVDIRAFYDLRNQPVIHPEQTLVRMADEHGMSDRTLASLIRELPDYTINGQSTMFDLVNLITNYANNDTLVNRFNARRSLEIMGGQVTYDHVTRCDQCSSRLSV